ncbi:MAG: tRNA (adenosine(37)-N6)-dimethylallyltransferase MiaA [Chitinispirillaceae bacterium]|nr:tRNA (adenosine(37)-N6)-dimethylallyltransferase MiaA [Chitinispirillaceae bacterium]
MIVKNIPCSSKTASSGNCGSITVPVVLGPTAIGKSAVALSIAKATGWDILSCDSRQLYRGMNIGTAKPTVAERASVQHWLIDILDPSEEYSAWRFADEAATIIRNRAKEGRTVMICGGTGLYFRALQTGQTEREPSDPMVREELTRYARIHGSHALHRELTAVDRATAARLHPNDTQRIIRALALFRQTGKAMADHVQEGTPPSDMRFIVIRLTMDRAMLYERINNRVDAMMREGLLEEFRRLRSEGYHRQTPGLQCVGYKELFATEEEASFDDAVAKIKRNTRRYAKRQITWFAHQVKGMEVDASLPSRALQQVREYLVKAMED